VIFSRRDFNMVMIMVAVLLLGMTYLLADPMIKRWREAAAVRSSLERDQAMAERFLKTRGELEGKLVSLRATLPTYATNEVVGAALLQQVRRLADENRVVTTRITPDEEKNIGDLYEQSIEAAWEAELEPLVRFLYAVQVAGATLDIRQMTVAPSQDSRLKGNLKIFFAYKRGDAEPETASGVTTP
jgi:type II secretory pathway component PulM